MAVLAAQHRGVLGQSGWGSAQGCAHPGELAPACPSLVPFPHPAASARRATGDRLLIGEHGPRGSRAWEAGVTCEAGSTHSPCAMYRAPFLCGDRRAGCRHAGGLGAGSGGAMSRQTARLGAAAGSPPGLPLTRPCAGMGGVGQPAGREARGCQGGCRPQGLPQGAYCCLQTPATGRGRPRLTARGDYREPGAAKRAKGEQRRG